MHKILWDAIKAVLRGKFMTVNAYIKQKERSQIKNVTFHFKILDKEEESEIQYKLTSNFQCGLHTPVLKS